MAIGLGSGWRVAGQNIATQPNPYIYTGSRVGGLKASTQTQPTNPFNYIGSRVHGSISGWRVDFGFMGQFQVRGLVGHILEHILIHKQPNEIKV